VAIVAATAHPGDRAWEAIADFGFVVSCAAATFAFLGTFIRFTKKRHPLWESLRDNSYGIYLIHYVIVSWLQYSLLKISLSAPAKGLVVFAGALTVGWILVAARRALRQ
jgi:surface polysaccharide O-acyltransferase-like enzyme